MDSFIFYGDYAKQIQNVNLQQIIGSNLTILEAIQKAAVEECISYLIQKYDTTNAFLAVSQHDKSKAYKAGQTVYLNASTYSPSLTYVLGAKVLQGGNVYVCTPAITVAEPFTIGHWTLVGIQYETYFAKYPNDLFNYLKVYVKGDKVFWKDRVYTCIMPSQILDHAALLQIGQAGTNRVVNIFPDDSTKGLQYWGAGESYSVPETTEITDGTFWTTGDNRDQKLLMTCIDIALYHVHARISPSNIPELRVHRYMGDPADRISSEGQRILYPVYSALGWLQSVTIGNDITPNLPILQPISGRRIRFGGNQKIINSY